MKIPTRELTAADHELVDLARAVVDANTDGEAGVHTMGAAVRAADGTMYGGINLYHFTGGPCAELVALGNARASGARELTTIVAVGNMGRGVVGPCGRDRQVLFDYHPGIRVILPTARGVIAGVRIEDLMPFVTAWSPEEGSKAFEGEQPGTP
ncbi:cytidine deaminase [Streptomyces sp. ERV7]|uniref:cytidine deaminase family protein n=1 Tax=Streptomyces sp. ERV7 TaxID=1322334 RepID=UPI0007F396D7|nr:cytidine deaminase [Streptomyces sp. ERV7]OAR22560.1 cytidine deaminase [Streptomyces sp. ERV7]